MNEIIKQLIDLLKDHTQWDLGQYEMTHKTKNIAMWVGNLGFSYALFGICPHFVINGHRVEADQIPMLPRIQLMRQVIKTRSKILKKNIEDHTQEILDSMIDIKN